MYQEITNRQQTHHRPPLQNPSEYITGPEDVMQIDLVPELSPSGDYKNIVIAMDRFSICSTAYPTETQDAKTIARVINNTMTKNVYIPKAIFPDKGSVFVSQVIEEVADVLRITFEHATAKFPQTNELLERTHASV